MLYKAILYRYLGCDFHCSKFCHLCPLDTRLVVVSHLNNDQSIKTRLYSAMCRKQIRCARCQAL